MEITLKVVSMLGVEVATLDNARVVEITWTLNEPETWAFELDPHDPKMALVPTGPLSSDEVQLWIDGVLRAWGPVVRRTKSTVQCRGLLWHFAHRFLGPVFSFIDSYNGSFETGSVGSVPAGWVDGGLDNRGITADVGLLGNRSFVAGVAVDPPADKFVSVTFGVVRPYPFNLDVSVWYLVGWNTGYGRTFQDRGLYLVLWDHATTTVLQEVNARLSLDVEPLGVWRRATARINVPAGDVDLEVRLYGAAGCTLYYDALDLLLEQRTHSVESEDASALVRRLVDYCVGNSFGGGPSLRDSDYVAKSDLRILWNAANTNLGRIGARSFDHADGASFASCLSEFPARNLCDFEITFNAAGTTRSFTTYGPRKGTDRSAWSFVLDDAGAGNLVDFDVIYDGERAASQVRVRGPGRGGAEAGLASTGGVLVEAMVSTNNDGDLNAIDTMAGAELARRSAGVQIPWIDVAGATALLAAGLTVGDTIRPRIRWAWVDVNAPYRVVAMTITDPDRDVVRLVLNQP